MKLEEHTTTLCLHLTQEERDRLMERRKDLWLYVTAELDFLDSSSFDGLHDEDCPFILFEFGTYHDTLENRELILDTIRNYMEGR